MQSETFIFKPKSSNTLKEVTKKSLKFTASILLSLCYMHSTCGQRLCRVNLKIFENRTARYLTFLPSSILSPFWKNLILLYMAKVLEVPVPLFRLQRTDFVLLCINFYTLLLLILTWGYQYFFKHRNCPP